MNENAALIAAFAAWALVQVTRLVLNYRKATRKPKGES